MNIILTSTRNTNPARSRRINWIPLIAGAIMFAVQFLGSPTSAAAYQQDFKVGDRVNISTFDTEGVVTGFQNGQPKVKFNANGLEMEMPLPADLLTKIESTGGNAAATNKNELRTWTSGKHKVKAKFLSKKNGKVELEKPDGLVVTLPTDKLSQEDQDYIEKFLLAKMEENPFAGGIKKTRRTPSFNNPKINNPLFSRGSLPEPDIEPNAIRNEIVLNPTDEWNVTADAAAPVEASNQVITPSGSVSGEPFFSRLTNFVVSTNRQFAATTATNRLDDFSELISVNIDTAKASPNKKIPLKDCKVLAISPSGKRVATSQGRTPIAPDRIDFWSTDGKELRPTASWKAAGTRNRNGFAPTRGAFLDESRLLTIGRRVALWDCETATSFYSFRISRTAPAFSPNKKQIAVANQGSIFIVDINDGNVLGTIENSGSELGGLAYSQNGRFLAGYTVGTGAIRIWDLNDGELIQQMAAPGGSANSIRWIGNRYLLVSKRSLMDVELRVSIWNYKIATEAILSAGDGRFWLVTREKLVPMKLPHKKLTKLTGSIDPEELLVLKPGTPVAIEFDLPFPPNEQKEIREHWVAQLEGMGATVNNSADLKLILTVKKGEPETKAMSNFHDPFGRRGGAEKVSYTPNTCKISLTRRSIELWQKSSTYSVNGFIQLKEAESAQAAATRLSQPQPAFFKNKIPPFIAALPSGKPLGSSSIGPQ